MFCSWVVCYIKQERQRRNSGPPATTDRLLTIKPGPVVVANPAKALKKGIPSDKKRSKKAVARGQRVRIPFPPMPALYGGPQKFDPKKKTATLTLSLRNEQKTPEQQNLRETLSKAEKVLAQLITQIDPARDPRDQISALRKNTFIRAGKPVPEGFGQGNYPDTIPLKMYPEDVVWKDVDGDVIDRADFSFYDYDVEPTVELRDVWKVGDTYYPRLVVTECVLHAQDVGPLISLPREEGSAEGDDA